MEKVITVLPAMKRAVTSEKASVQRVAAYARVSTDFEEQLTSYAAQIDYYTHYINGREGWQLVDIYTDEGITGTSTKHREGFKRMVNDALDGKIDLIITKSISRFARNTVDTLTTVRKLKEKGIEVYFEKENIRTLDSKGELLITIMSSLAQEESRSISENVKWGHRKRFADGKAYVPFARFLGYDRAEDGSFKINEEQAKIVRLIYKLYLKGKSYHGIAKELVERGIPNPSGGNRWHTSTIMNILSNEKYRGDALLQKTYVADFLTKRSVKNKGEVQQYYVENNHEAIIDPRIFELVQQEHERRNGGKYSGSSIFSNRVKCGSCGSWFGAKVWHSTDKYRRVIYRCNRKYDKRCNTAHVTENELEKGFIKAMGILMKEREDIIASLEEAINVVGNVSELECRMDELELRLEELSVKAARCIDKSVASGKENTEYDALYGKYKMTEAEHERLEAEISDRKNRLLKIGEVLAGIKATSTIVDKFDDNMWYTLIEYVTVKASGKLVYTFKSGQSIEI